MTPNHDRRQSDHELHQLGREVSALIGKFDEYLKSTDKLCAMHHTRTNQLENIIQHHEEQIQKVLVAAEAFAKHEEDEKWKWRTAISTLFLLVGNTIWEWVKEFLNRK